MADPRSGRGTSAHGRDSRRDAQLDRPPGARHLRVRRQGPSPGSKQAGARDAGLHRGQHQRRVRRRGRDPAGRATPSTAVVGVEVNISCPNVANRGLVFGVRPDGQCQGRRAGARAAAAGHPPSSPSSAPDVTDIASIAAACVKAGADGLTMINTLLGMVIDTDRMRPAARRRDRRALAVRGSGRSRCGRSGRCARRWPRAGSGRCRSSGSGECAPAATRSSWSPPGPAPSRSAPPTFNDPTAPGAGAATSWHEPRCRTQRFRRRFTRRGRRRLTDVDGRSDQA